MRPWGARHRRHPLGPRQPRELGEALQRRGGDRGGGAGDQLGPELVALAGDVAQAQALDAEHRRTVARPRSSNRTARPGGGDLDQLGGDRGGGADGPGRLGARRSVLAGDVAQELGQLAEGGGNLGASTRSAALARPWSSWAPCSRSWRSTGALVLDVAQERLGERGSDLDLDPAGAVGGSPIAALVLDVAQERRHRGRPRRWWRRRWR